MPTGDGKLIDIEINKYHPDDTLEDLFHKYEDNFVEIIDKLNSISSRIHEENFIVKSDKDNIFTLPTKYNTRQNCIQVFKNGLKLSKDEFEESSSTSIKVYSVRKGDKITVISRLYFDMPNNPLHAETHKLNGVDELDISELADSEGLLTTLRSMMPSMEEIYNAYAGMQHKFDSVNNKITSLEERISLLEGKYSKIKIEGIRVFDNIQALDNQTMSIGDVLLIKDIGINDVVMSGFYVVEEKADVEVISPNFIHNNYYMRYLSMPLMLNDYKVSL